MSFRSPVIPYFLQVGVTFKLIPGGLDNTSFEKGLTSWRKQNPEISLGETTSQQLSSI